jgi:anti-anti-sigma factor
MANLTYKDIAPDFRHVTLSGRMDIQGTEAVELQLTTLIAQAQRIVIDMADITFLASIGIRLLIASGKALKQKGGRIALVVGENAAVIKTIKTTCGDLILPMHKTFEQAEASIKG